MGKPYYFLDIEIVRSHKGIVLYQRKYAMDLFEEICLLGAKLVQTPMPEGVAITVPLLTNEQFSALILMAFITTMMAPITLKWSIVKTCLPEEKADFCRLWDETTRK